jgi:UDP-glucose 4-epimerase
MVLVTGGTGYIGAHTVVALLQAGIPCIIIDNCSRSSGKAILGIKAITGHKVQHYNINICNKEACEQIFKQHNITGVIHFAAYKYVWESMQSPGMYYHNNITSLLNILDCCVQYNVNNFIFSSSCSVYGNASELPVTELTPIGTAQSVYASTKQIGERIVSDYCVRYGIKAAILRYFNPVGAHPSAHIGEEPFEGAQNLMPALVQFAAGKLPQFNVWGTQYNTPDGSCVRDFVHVSDIANAHVAALQYTASLATGNSTAINLGTGNGVSVLQIINTFEALLNKKLGVTYGAARNGDVVSIYANNNLAKQLLGWTCQYTVHDMLATAWQWEQGQ